MRHRHGFGAAVLTGQATGLCHLPVDQQRISRKIVSDMAHLGCRLRGDHCVPPPAEIFERTPQATPDYVSGWGTAVIVITLRRDLFCKYGSLRDGARLQTALPAGYRQIAARHNL